MTDSNGPRRVLIAGQVDAQSASRQKPLRVNGRRVFFSCAVVQNFGRLRDGKLHVNRNGVSLIRPENVFSFSQILHMNQPLLRVIYPVIALRRWKRTLW